MRKKVNLLILLFVAVLVVSLALVACGKIQDVTKAPDDIGVLDLTLHLKKRRAKLKNN